MAAARSQLLNGDRVQVAQDDEGSAPCKGCTECEAIPQRTGDHTQTS